MQLRKKSSNSSKSEDRTTKIHNKDCELMGLTWLLAKNRTAYIHTVSGVLRALMLSTEGSDPQSCTLNSDGMPLAVDSSEMSDESSSTNLQAPIFLSLLLFLHYFTLLWHLTENECKEIPQHGICKFESVLWFLGVYFYFLSWVLICLKENS